MSEPKAHLRRPEDPGRTYCGRTMQPWRTFTPQEAEAFTTNGTYGLTQSHICRRCDAAAR